jgi:hypothetical protein
MTVISSVPIMLWLGQMRTKESTNVMAPVGAVVAVKDET